MKLIPKPDHSSLEWLTARQRDENGRTIVGGSDAPALMNASPYRNRADLFMEKTTAPQPQPFNMAFHRGNLLEPALVQEASRVLKIDLHTPDVMYRSGRWNINSDAVDNTETPTVQVECKTTTRFTVESADDLPAEWRWQGWAQMAVLNVPVFFSVLDARQNLAVVELQRDQSAIDALLVEAEAFCGAVDRGDALDDVLEMMTATHIATLFPSVGTATELPEDARSLVVLLEEARRAKKDAEQQEADARDALARLLLSNDVGMINGEPVVSWKEQRGKSTVDVVALREAHPEIVAQFERIGSPYRVMRIVTKKKEKNNAI